MSQRSCDTCGEVFTRASSLRRHVTRKHEVSELSEKMKESGDGFKLGHPFTMLLCGPTACGKTTLMKEILQKNHAIISPPPQRIVWLYKRWQPLYDVIKATVNPSVQFIQGIPPGIDQPTFFNPKVNNLLIIDDLMSSCGDDPRMTEIFYEGSHHRSLSVVLLCQNLYYSKSPTQRRNSHYIVLFKNPNDLQSVMTFAKQINPQRAKEMMRAYDAATAKPHGYLLLDFKQTTEEKDRLKANVLNDVSTKPKDEDHDTAEDTYSSCLNHPLHLREPHQPEHIELPEEDKMVSCDTCGIVMDSIHDLQRHLTMWCPLKQQMNMAETASQSRNHWPSQFVPSNERKRHDINFSEDREMKRFKMSPKSEYECFTPIRREISQLWQKVIRNGQQQYQKEGFSERTAKTMCLKENIKEIRQDLREAYVQFIKHWMEMNENSKIHQKVMLRVEELHDQENLAWADAARLAIKEYKPIIIMNALPDLEDESDEESEDEYDGDDEKTETENDESDGEGDKSDVDDNESESEDDESDSEDE